MIRPSDTRGRSREGGFTIVEILVAVTIVALVLGGVVWMVMSSAKASQRSDIRQKMAAAADGLAQQVRSNKDWLDAQPACKEKACVPGPLEKYSYRAKSKNDPKFTSAIEITPVDSPVDGMAAADKDHIIPDMYRISVTISLTPEEEAVWGKQTPFNLVSTVDATQLGKATGSLTIQACVVNNQVDERMAIAGCKAKAQQLEMRYQPPCKSDETLSPIELERRVAVGQTLPLSCNAAIAETKDIKKDGFAPGSVDVKPMPNQEFDIVPVEGTQAMPRDQKMADTASDDGAAWTFSGLGTGTYEIKLRNVPLHLEVWESHVVPQDLKVSIQSNQEAKAMIILRPKQAKVNAHYEALLMRNVYVYQLRTIEQTTMMETPDPAHFAVVHATTRYRYLKADLWKVEPRTGPSWNGYLAMEPKPFDRYREKGSKQNRQYVKRVGWKAEPMVDDPSDGVVVWNAATGSPMPTGLYSRPEQLSVQQSGFYGQLDKEIPFRGVSVTFNKIYDLEGIPLPIFKLHVAEGKMICTAAPCGNDYVWLDAAGQPTSKMLFYDMADGECYIESAVPEVPMPQQLMGGGELEGTGVFGQDRCERDFTINGVRIGNFVPDRSGMDGKTVLWRTNMNYFCVPADSCVPRPDIDRMMTPNPGTIVASDAGILPTPLRTDIVPMVKCTSAQYVPPSTCPPPAPWTVASVNPLQALLNIPKPEISAEEKKKKAICEQYNGWRQDWLDYNQTEASMDAKGWKKLECSPQCPSTSSVNRPFSAYASGGNGEYYGTLSEFGAAGTGVCPPGINSLSMPYNDPPPAPFVEPPPYTGTNPDQAGTPAIPFGGIPGSTPLINGGTLASNGQRGVAGTCFVAGTNVLMADGSYRKIEDIEVGDQVMSGDPRSARKVPRTVTKLWERPTDEILVELSTRTGAFTTTAYHPIWNTVRNMWWGAFDMTGSYGLGSDDKQHPFVRSETHKEVGTPVYNITIGGTDAYFVKAGEDDILVRAQEPDGKLSYNPPGA